MVLNDVLYFIGRFDSAFLTFPMNNFGIGCSGNFHTLTKGVIEQKQNVEISMSQLLAAHQACSDLARKYISQLICTPSSLTKKKA